MKKGPGLTVIGSLLLIILCAPVTALPEMIDVDGRSGFIDLGRDVLTIDYMEVRDNGVITSGTDYPYGRIWLILYDPLRYENRDLMEEEDWNRTHEIDRFEIPGPSSRERWINDDAVVFRNLGIYNWGSGELDRIVFRIIVEEPSDGSEVLTIMWGTIYEDDSYTTLEYTNDSLDVYFRTCELPEEELRLKAEFNEMWFVHEVKSEGFMGIELHVRFDVTNMRGEVGRLAAYVHEHPDGESVRGNLDNPLYRTPAGWLTVQEDFMPFYPDTTFTDFILFFPYDAFPISDDYVDYVMNVEIADEDGDVIRSTFSPVFSVLNPAQPE